MEMTFENKLPEGFERTLTIEPEKDIKLRLKLDGAAAVIALSFVLLGSLVKDIGLLFEAAGGAMLALRVVLVTVLCVLSLYISEYIKCAVVGGVTGKPARVVREKYWAYTEFRCWLDKKSFMTISFAPALAVCLAMLILMLVLPGKFFWQCYAIFIVNLTGTVGDGYTALVLARQAGEVRIKTEGLTTYIATEK